MQSIQYMNSTRFQVGNRVVRTYYNDVNYKLFAALVGMDEITKIVDGNKFTICKINMNWNAKNIPLGLPY